jgi:hypothetical protein
MFRVTRRRANFGTRANEARLGQPAQRRQLRPVATGKYTVVTIPAITSQRAKNIRQTPMVTHPQHRVSQKRQHPHVLRLLRQYLDAKRFHNIYVNIAKLPHLQFQILVIDIVINVEPKWSAAAERGSYR